MPDRVHPQASRFRLAFFLGRRTAAPTAGAMIWRRVLVVAAAGWLLGPRASAQEFRGLWVDAFNAGLKNAAEVTAVVAAARAKNVNAIFAQVRKRGDAYYRNGLEPVAVDIDAGFDPLNDLIAKAHDTAGGRRRIEVHAWIVTYNIWNRETTAPPQPDHPYRQHPGWLSQKFRARPADPVVHWDGANYPFDQGHPEVQQHVFDVAMDIVRRHDVDGLHFDYLRYSDDAGANDQPWGYHPVSVARFNELKRRTGTPLPTDPQWLQWRRDQVTALLRKTYLHARAEKPAVRISAALICYDPAPTLSANSWTATSAYNRVLQDWRAWLEEGILDLGCAMAYKTSNASVAGWTAFLRERQYNRAGALGLGWYLNPIEQTIDQVKIARTPGANGRRAAGVLGYSYAFTNNASVPRSTFELALTDAATAALYDPGGTPVFGEPASPPDMPWKNDPGTAQLMGFVRQADTGAAVDGAVVTLSGPVVRTAQTDGTGFYGLVDLPVGAYAATISSAGGAAQQHLLNLAGPEVAHHSFRLGPPALTLLSVSWDAENQTLALTWTSAPGEVFTVEFSGDLETWSPLVSGVPGGGPTTSYRTPPLPAGIGQRFWRVRRE
jgi:uncharacterized lipoprotein YddW (UPF0748 family)